MKRIFRYTAIVIALSLAASCNIMEEGISEEGQIRFEPQAVKTKALVNPDNVTSEQFAVWDLLDGTEYIQNSIKYVSGKWAYQNPANATYYWKNGTHKFFGYTYNKGTFSNNVWSISSMAITATANQTDLLYADTTVTAAAWKAVQGHTKDTPLPLTFHHLLSALRITMVNGSGSNVTVTNANVTLPNTGSATVSFAGTPAAPSCSVTASGTFGGFTSQTMSAGDSLDVLTGAVLSDKAPAYVIWPQDIDDDDATITFKLAYGTNAATEKTVPLPAGTWTAGKINNYRLLIYPDNIKLVFEVQPWDKVTVDPVDTPTGSINMSNVSWQNTTVRTSATGDDINTVNNNGYSVTMYYRPYVNTSTTATPSWTPYTDQDYYPAQGYFTVNYPLEGKFKIGLIPAYGQTEADLHADMYEIYVWDETATDPDDYYFRKMKAGGEDLSDWREYTGTDVKGVNTIYFQVRASSSVPASHSEYKAQIDIWFLPEGESEWISAYSEIRANYALIIPAR